MQSKINGEIFVNPRPIIKYLAFYKEVDYNSIKTYLIIAGTHIDIPPKYFKRIAL